MFYCGFCGDGKTVELKDGEVWDERYNHIERHFLEEEKRYERDWKEPGEEVVKMLEKQKEWCCCLCGGNVSEAWCKACDHPRCEVCEGKVKVEQEGPPVKRVKKG